MSKMFITCSWYLKPRWNIFECQQCSTHTTVDQETLQTNTHIYKTAHVFDTLALTQISLESIKRSTEHVGVLVFIHIDALRAQDSNLGERLKLHAPPLILWQQNFGASWIDSLCPLWGRVQALKTTPTIQIRQMPSFAWWSIKIFVSIFDQSVWQQAFLRTPISRSVRQIYRPFFSQ
jgi:hypothetical protein